MDRRTWIKIAGGAVVAPATLYGAWQFRDEVFEKRFAVVVPGRLYRGAWQSPIPLRRILTRERIKTVVTLTAINRDDPKYVAQQPVLDSLGVAWRFVPIHGSYASVAQMARAADLLADPALQPIFFHCVAGHHRSSQAQAAYRMQHDGWTADRAWAEVAALPWARPTTDVGDHRLIDAFALAHPAPSPTIPTDRASLMTTARTRLAPPGPSRLSSSPGPIGWRFGLSDNFATVRPAALYRSGQMGAPALASALDRHRIKTVLNLRGSHPESAWYRAERAATLAAGATQVDIPMSSCEWMSRAQARALLEVLDSAERPLLVHCFHGSERTGLVAAFAELLRPGSTLADADAQFSMAYLYFGIGDGVVTHHQLVAYEDWLQANHLAHAPDQLRRWVRDGYEPGKPSREQWAFDPYPLVVTTKPVARVTARR